MTEGLLKTLEIHIYHIKIFKTSFMFPRPSQEMHGSYQESLINDGLIRLTVLYILAEVVCKMQLVPLDFLNLQKHKLDNCPKVT